MALPFNLMNLVARAPANKVVDQNLIEAERIFGIPDFVMAEDMVNYYKDAPPNLDIQPRPGAINPNISGIYNPNLLPLNFNNNDRDNINMGLGSPDLELENMYEDEDRFDDTLDKKKGIMEILGMLPTPLNITRKGIDFFKDYRENKKQEIEAAKILEQMRQERIKNEQIAAEKKAAQDFMNKNPNYGNQYDKSKDHSGDGGYGNTGGDSYGDKSGTRSRDNRSSDLGFSDIRLKENVELIGKSPSNINIYKFNYKDNPTTYQGAMAHEVPWASIKHSNGYMMVDYSQIDVEFKKI